MSILTTSASSTTSTAGTELSPVAAKVLALFRVIVSVLFLCHGLQGFGMFGGIDGHGAAVPLLSEGGLASIIETAGPVLLIIGLAARPTAVLLSGTMAFAYFTVHAPMALLPLANMGEPAALYSWIFLLIAVVGPGSYTLDQARRARRS